ncbi:MAG: sugar phosphate isomerase/epimerase family protein [Planctomycetota bacterium]|jgi:sugar phosphate isomerase/epimerase
MNKHTRREFIKIAGLGIIALSGLNSNILNASELQQSSNNSKEKIRLGVASYTFRKFNLDEAIAMTKRLGLKYIAFKSFHLPMDSTEEQIKSAAKKVKQAGLVLYGGGVIYVKDEQQVEQAFKYAKAAGMKVIIGVPNHEMLELVEQNVKTYDIKVAIHNHGSGDPLYPTPQSVYDKIKDLDPRIGLCIDIGHSQRVGVDPANAAKMYASRLHDVHIKDISQSNPEGEDLEVGRGIIDMPKLLRTLVEIKYSGVVSFEYEKDAEDPLAGLAESVGYVRGVLASI